MLGPDHHHASWLGAPDVTPRNVDQDFVTAFFVFDMADGEEPEVDSGGDEGR